VYVPGARRKDDHQMAAQRVRDYLVPQIGRVLLSRLRGDGVRRQDTSTMRRFLGSRSGDEPAGSLRVHLPLRLSRDGIGSL